MPEKPFSILLLNQDWLAGELRALGHSIISAGLQTPHLDVSIEDGPIAIGDLLRRLDFMPERIVYYDDSGLSWITGLEDCSIPKLFYSIDSHHHKQWHAPFGGLFDAVLTAHRDHLDDFLACNPASHWAPVWATLLPVPHEPKTIDACFRGSMDPRIHPERAQFFKKLQSYVSIDAGPGLWTEAYPQAKIVVNQSVAADLNFRIFEAMASGALLITPRIENGLLELFEEDRDIVLYDNGNAESAAKKINLYLADDQRRVDVARSGREKVLAFHTNGARAALIEKILAGLSVRSDSRKAGYAVDTYMFTALARRELGYSPSIEIASAAAKAVLRTIRNGADPRDELIVRIVQIGGMLDAAGGSKQAADLFLTAADQLSASGLLRLFAIDQLLRCGGEDLARTLAVECGLPAGSPGDSRSLAAIISQLLDEPRREIEVNWRPS